MNDTPAKTLAETPEAAPNAPVSTPIKTFSDFEDAMLAAARDLYLDEDLRREVSKRIS